MRTFLANTRGNVAILCALALPILVGVGAYAIDLSWLYYNQNRLQTAADAAASGAALLLPNTQAALTRAVQLAQANVPSEFGTVTSNTDVQFGTYDTAKKAFTVSTSNINAVKVTAHRTATNSNAATSFLASTFGINSSDVSTSSLAVGVGPGACFIVLDASANNALNASGGGALLVPNCGIWVNSSASQAISTSNNTTLSAKSISVVGGYSGTTLSPAPTTKVQAIKDPLASVPEPTASATCITNPTTPTWNPGTYCGAITLNGTGSTVLNPGNYYFKGVTLKINNSASLSGQGVMLFLDATSSIDFGSSGTVNLSAPTSGTYMGILIFQSRSSPSNTLNKIVGGPSLLLDGTIYMPSVGLKFTGSGALTDTAKSGYVIVNTFNYTGSVTFKFDSYSGTVASSLAPRGVLVQ